MDGIIPIPVVEIRDGKPVTTSLQVAEYFGKDHYHVMRDIRNIIKKEPEFGAENFGLTLEIKHLGNVDRKTPHYTMTFDGFSVLVMGFTGAKAMKFKIAYTKEFRRMADELSGTKLNKLERALKAVIAFDRAKQVASDAGRALANWRVKKPVLENERETAIEEAQPTLPLF